MTKTETQSRTSKLSTNAYGYTDSIFHESASHNTKNAARSYIEETKTSLQKLTAHVIVCECAKNLGSIKKKSPKSTALLKGLKKALKHHGENIKLGWVKLHSPFVNIEQMGNMLEKIMGKDKNIRLTIMQSKNNTNSLYLAGSIIGRCESIHLPPPNERK